MKPPKRAAQLGRLAPRVHGGLLGLSIGDALGSPLSGRRTVAPDFPALASGPHRDFAGGGPSERVPGQVSWRTEFAFAAATSLLALRRYDDAQMLRKYLAVEPGADFDVQTQAVLDRLREGAPKERAAKEHWTFEKGTAASNAALTRSIPIGLFHALDGAARRSACLADCALTHFDARCQLAGVALNASIARAATSPTCNAEQLVQAARADLALASAALGKSAGEHVQRVADAVRELASDLEAAQRADPLLYGPELHLHAQPSFVRVTFRLAYWELLHAPTLEAAIVDAANRGGDAGTNAAVTGALCGALHGEEQLPRRWLTVPRRLLMAADDF